MVRVHAGQWFDAPFALLGLAHHFAQWKQALSLAQGVVMLSAANHPEQASPCLLQASASKGRIMWYVYMLACEGGSIYTGITDNIGRRFSEHSDGKGGHYTNYNRPKKILYKESYNSRVSAEKREQQIKRWSRAKKLALIRGDKECLISLSKSRD
jgi:putative endonuclease